MDSMPKKTRKEKILAEYRRKLKLLEEKKRPEIFIEKAQSPKYLKKEIEHTDNKIIDKPIDTKEDKAALGYFFQDLKKSLVFILIIISVEVLLYFVKI